jgi:hypothetical protein
MNSESTDQPFDLASDERFRTYVREVRYKWLVRDATQSTWYRLAGAYSMRQMSEFIKGGRFSDIEVVEMQLGPEIVGSTG